MAMHSTSVASPIARFRQGGELSLTATNEAEKASFLRYAFARNYGGLVGQFKLDWIFVKPFVDDPRRAKQSYRFAPHFPVTMRELNESVEDRISDHPPMTVDLPLTEPTIESPREIP